MKHFRVRLKSFPEPYTLFPFFCKSPRLLEDFDGKEHSDRECAHSWYPKVWVF